MSFKPCQVHQNKFYFQCLIGYAHRHDTVGIIKSSCRIIFSSIKKPVPSRPLSTHLCYNIYIKSGI